MHPFIFYLISYEIRNGLENKFFEVTTLASFFSSSWMPRLSRSQRRFETQDIKTQPQFNHYLRNDLGPESYFLSYRRLTNQLLVKPP
jgi:hypothetical protein